MLFFVGVGEISLEWYGLQDWILWKEYELEMYI